MSTTERLNWTDRVLELEVGPIAHGGHCVARHEGRVVFVRHALPGERVIAVVVEDGGGGFCRADAVSVREAAPQRVPAPCAWARAGGCGGCDFQHADPALQRALKGEVLAEQLRRLAGIERAVEVEELPGGALGWRHRVRLAVDSQGRPGLRAHRSHDVLPIADCPIAPAGALPPVLEHRFDPGGEVEVAVDAAGAVHVGAEIGAGGPVVQRAAGREWRLTPGVFWQVHPALPDALAAVVAEWADAPAGGTAWDLYGGVGLFAAVLAAQVGRDGAVTVVESSRQAVADGRAALADLPQVDWRPGRVEQVLGGLTARPDVVVADPPRRGLGRALVEALCAREPDRVVHVACDPAALARDVALFADRGYRLDGLRAFDAFPMTHHFESVALLGRA
ncbi:class I SAM-dependent RNA methyltransferase [Pseudonocardia sichuanensis]